jgi:hypothetical protein
MCPHFMLFMENHLYQKRTFTAEGALECKRFKPECKSSDREPKVQVFLNKCKNSNQSESF